MVYPEFIDAYFAWQRLMSTKQQVSTRSIKEQGNDYDNKVVFGGFYGIAWRNRENCNWTKWHTFFFLKVEPEIVGNDAKLLKLLKFYIWHYAESTISYGYAEKNLSTHAPTLVKEFANHPESEQCQELLTWLNTENIELLLGVVKELKDGKPEHVIAKHIWGIVNYSIFPACSVM